MPLKQWLAASFSFLSGSAATKARSPGCAPPAENPTSQPASALQFTVEEVFYVKPPVDRVILVGTITEGTVLPGQKATVRTANGAVEVVVEGIEGLKRGDLKKASKGDQVGLRLTGIKKDEPSRGDKVTTDGDRPQDRAAQPTTAPSGAVQESDVPSEQIRRIRDRVPEMPIIVLSRQPDPKSRVLDIQDYFIGGENVFPIFSSKDALAQSLGGSDLGGRPTFAISRPLLGQVLKGNEVFLLDPRLPSQIRFTAGEFRAAFPQPFLS